MSYVARRGLGAVRLPVDLLGFVSAPDDGCPWTHVMRNGVCLTPDNMGGWGSPLEDGAMLRDHQPITTDDPLPGMRVMFSWHGVGPWQRYTTGLPAVWDGAANGYVSAAPAAGAPTATPAPTSPTTPPSLPSSPSLVTSSNAASAAPGGAAAGGAHLSSSFSSLVDTAKGMPTWAWALAAGAVFLFMQGGGRGK